MPFPFPVELLSSYDQIEPWSGDQGPIQRGQDLGEQEIGTERRHLEMILDRGNWLFWAISVVDQNWHTEVYEGRSVYKPDEEKMIIDFYKEWLRPAGSIMPRIEKIESQGYLIVGAEKFRNNCREVQGLLTDDADFFDSDALADLRDRVIDAHQEGRTADFNVLGE